MRVLILFRGGVIQILMIFCGMGGVRGLERLSEQEFGPRRLEGLRAAAARKLEPGLNPETWVDEGRWSAAHARLALPASWDEREQANRYFETVEWVSLWDGLVADTDIQIIFLLRTWLEFQNSDHLSAIARNHLNEMICTWETPNRDRNQRSEQEYEWPGEYTENHTLNILTAAYFQDVLLGRDRTLRRQLLGEFLWDRSRWGWSEFYSASYGRYTVQPLLLLADFAPDPEIQKMATMLLDLLILDFAGHSLGWFRGVPYARGGERGTNNRNNSLVDMIRHWFGDPTPGAKYEGPDGIVGALTSRYRPPALAGQLCHDREFRGRYAAYQTVTHGPSRMRVPLALWVTPAATMATAQGAGHYYDGHYGSVSFATDPARVVSVHYGRGRNMLQIGPVAAVFGEVRYHGGLRREPVEGVSNAWETVEGGASLLEVRVVPGVTLLVLDEAGHADGKSSARRVEELAPTFEGGILTWRMPDGQTVRVENRQMEGRWSVAGAWVGGRWWRVDKNRLYDSPWLRSERESGVAYIRDGRGGWRYDFRNPQEPQVERISLEQFPSWPEDEIEGPLGIQMVRIPAGSFPAGSRGGEGRMSERPFRWGRTEAFYISRLEITVGQFRAFGESELSSGRMPPFPVPPWNSTERHPQVGVSWREAVAFCEWLTGRYPGRFRLPTEEEWEKAARGWSYRIYPWGDTYDGTQAGQRTGTLAEGGSYPGDTSPFGVQDMGGSVWEWCGDVWLPGGEVPWRVLKGCGWNFDPDTFRIAHRRGWREDGRSVHIGFRVVWEPDAK